ncbi:hypothetical protein MARBORIA2_11220 [Methanobrevibacter arboriphilus]|uniref:Uncharacterized protein n=1 Tax=Methanobrevibacter arboriphilus TaxID=39441 RepID=A0ACA8R6U9_METAZ|nr:hypothetical protein [Methanobrevibacter arboriphilus]MCC7561393.1 hypothetical protein [Methanobrevibacter arboriphilus]BBL62790.1 hypothetical protein MarbSA_18300 [Methanobrevibacter arboriphilus]GLI12032.1 hypothetical protein MARBORIA2_11220 [Methanobrevibacter arboriphilus]
MQNLKDLFKIYKKTKIEIEELCISGGWYNPPDLYDKLNYHEKIAVYSYAYGYERSLRNDDLTGFVSIITGLISNISASFGMPTKKDIRIKNKSIDLLNSLSEVDDETKAKVLISFVLKLYKSDKELIVKTIRLSEKHIEKIESYEGNNFSDKLRNLIDSI